MRRHPRLCGVNDRALEIGVFLADADQIYQLVAVLGDEPGGANAWIVILFRFASGVPRLDDEVGLGGIFTVTLEPVELEYAAAFWCRSLLVKG